MRGYRLWLLLVIALIVTFGPGCTKSEQPQLSADDTQKMAEASKQAETNVRADQINRSNLPPEQKQRLLEQLRAGTGK